MQGRKQKKKKKKKKARGRSLAWSLSLSVFSLSPSLSQPQPFFGMPPLCAVTLVLACVLAGKAKMREAGMGAGRAHFNSLSSIHHHPSTAPASAGHGYRHAAGYDSVTGLTSPQVKWAPPPPVAFVRGRIVNAESGAGVRMQVREKTAIGGTHRECFWGGGARRLHRPSLALPFYWMCRRVNSARIGMRRLTVDDGERGKAGQRAASWPTGARAGRTAPVPSLSPFCLTRLPP